MCVSVSVGTISFLQASDRDVIHIALCVCHCSVGQLRARSDVAQETVGPNQRC